MDLTKDYTNSVNVPDLDAIQARWEAEAPAFRDALGDRAEVDVPYGDAARQRFDLFRPDGAAAGLMVFIHGGYWRRFDKSVWSHFAAGGLARSWAVAMPSYTLAPEVPIAAITREISQALTEVASRVDGPIVVTGHSAGGHLSARMRCRDVALPDAVAGRIRRIVPISPVSDLRPLMLTDMNADLRLTEEEAAAESPVLKADLRDIDTTVWVGAEERPVFLDQARWLADAWPATALRIAPGRHHFDVIDGLEDPASPLMRSLLDGIG